LPPQVRNAMQHWNTEVLLNNILLFARHCAAFANKEILRIFKSKIISQSKSNLQNVQFLENMMEEKTRLAAKPTNLAQDNQVVFFFNILGANCSRAKTLGRMTYLVTTGLDSDNRLHSFTVNSFILNSFVARSSIVRQLRQTLHVQTYMLASCFMISFHKQSCASTAFASSLHTFYGTVRLTNAKKADIIFV